MSILNSYLRGSDLLGGSSSQVTVELDAIVSPVGLDTVVTETERAVAEVEAAERLVFAPFEIGEKTLPIIDTTTRPLQRVLKSEIPNVSDEAWTRFVFAVKTAQPSAVSASNALGMFELKARRLADLGLVENIKRARSPLGRLMWVGEFVSPLTQREFLSKPAIQYQAFVDSIKAYIENLRTESIPKPDGGFPLGMSLSGALAVLHRGGPNGLKSWNDEENRFEDTVSLYERANGIF